MKTSQSHANVARSVTTLRSRLARDARRTAQNTASSRATSRRPPAAAAAPSTSTRSDTVHEPHVEPRSVRADQYSRVDIRRLRCRFLRQSPRAHRNIAASARSTSPSEVAHEDTLMRITVRPCQRLTPHQHVPSRCNASITRNVVPRRRTRPIPDSERRRSALRVRRPAALRRTARRVRSSAIRDRLRRPTKVFQRGPHVDRAGALRCIRPVVHRIAQPGRRQIRRSHCHCGAQCARRLRTSAMPQSYGTFSHL